MLSAIEWACESFSENPWVHLGLLPFDLLPTDPGALKDQGGIMGKVAGAVGPDLGFATTFTMSILDK